MFNIRLSIKQMWIGILDDSGSGVMDRFMMKNAEKWTQLGFSRKRF